MLVAAFRVIMAQQVDLDRVSPAAIRYAVQGLAVAASIGVHRDEPVLTDAQLAGIGELFCTLLHGLCDGDDF